MIRRVSLRIHHDRRSGLVALLTLALLVAAFLGYLAWGQREASASAQAPAAGSAGMRRYYQTNVTHDGAEANTACAPGYHMASLWEILDPSALKYNISLGEHWADSGQGPPSGYIGWVRTGWSSSSSGTSGMGNCNNWSSNNGSDYGTGISLSHSWAAPQTIYAWDVTTMTCSAETGVWCVEDIVYKIYLPLVLRNHS